MNADKLQSLCTYLKKEQKKLRPHFTREETECYRIFNRNIGDIPLFIDRYKDYIYITLIEEKRKGQEIPPLELDDDQIKQIAGALYVPLDHVIIKSRKKLSEHQQHQKENSEEDKSIKFIAKENGLNFNINLTDYIDTGLFLDHRNTRLKIREAAFGQRVLNLFAYTGSFSVYAVAGGAEEVTTVDLSSTYLNWAKDNFRANDFLPGVFEFIQDDTLKFLDKAIAEGRKWDLIILDPPTFSNSRKMDGVFDVQKDHEQMIRKCGKLLAKGGYIFFSTNYKMITFQHKELSDRFKTWEITGETKGLDFAGQRAHRCWQIEVGKDKTKKKGQSKGHRRSSKDSHSGGKESKFSQKKGSFDGKSRKK